MLTRPSLRQALSWCAWFDLQHDASRTPAHVSAAILHAGEHDDRVGQRCEAGGSEPYSARGLTARVSSIDMRLLACLVHEQSKQRVSRRCDSEADDIGPDGAIESRQRTQ